MYKRLLKTFTYQQFLTKYPRLNLGVLCVMVLCILLMLIGTFSQFHLNKFSILWEALFHPIKVFSDLKYFSQMAGTYYYIPQIPIVLFIGMLLGPRIGVLTTIIYTILGCAGVPLFASGGGVHYFTHQTFGYILGYILGCYLVGKIAYKRHNLSFMLRAAIIGVIAIHLIGIIFLASLMLFEHSGIMYILNWIYTLSIKQIPYDILFGFLAIFLGLPTRGLLWIIMG